MSDFVYIVLRAVSLACLMGGSLFLCIHGNGSLLLVLRHRAVARQIPDPPPGKFEWGGPDHLTDSILFLFELIPIELDPLAPLADFGPAADVLGGDPQLRRLAGLPNLCFDLAEYLVDQRHGSLVVAGGSALRTFGSLAVGGGALRTFGSLAVSGGAFHPFGFLHEIPWIPFRVRGLRVRWLAIRVVRLRLFLLALLGAVLAGLRPVVRIHDFVMTPSASGLDARSVRGGCGGLAFGDHLLHHPPLLLAGLQAGHEDLRSGLGGCADHPGLHRAPSGVHELERRAEVLQRERLEPRGDDRYAIVRGVSGEAIFDLPLEGDRHVLVEEPSRNLG